MAAAAHPTVIRFQEVFNQLDRDHLHLVRQLYADEIHFEDPIHAMDGIATLEAYFQRLYQGVESCKFDFHSALEGDGEAMLVWTMILRHRTFQPGKTVRVAGSSWIQFKSDKVTFHRDFFDVGALIYERVPVLGAMIKTIKGRL